LYQIFEKAGHKGWKALIPFYNLYVIQKIIDKPWWWAILMFIPYLGIIWIIWSTNRISRIFGKGALFTLGLVLLPFIFYPILAFGDAQYNGTLNETEEENELS
jgi:FtsH-binding integral membrane protein